jgi:hypothetical protein
MEGIMARTRTPGITIDSEGLRTINKEHRCVRIFVRLGAVARDHAEHRLAQEIQRLDWELDRRAHARPLFADCAKRYLAESKYKRSQPVIAWHVRMLLSYVGGLEARKVHDETLRPFIEARLDAGASPTTINRTLEIVRTNLVSRCARLSR